MNENGSNIWKIIIAVIATALLTYFGSQYLPGNQEYISKDSTSTFTTIKVEEQNTFIAELKSKLKTQLLDSLKATLKPQLKIVYKDPKYNLDSLIAEAKREAVASLKGASASSAHDSTAKPVFISNADTNYVTKDSLGRTRDSLNIHSEIISPIPLHSAVQHSINIGHKSFSYDQFSEKRVETTKTITKRSFWDNIQPGLIAAYGYGIKSGSWEFFIGAGANLDIQGLIKSLQEK
ncbi:MAG: hypothetical protein FIA82_10820 [Melioribacter sp.]|nr:hypothetical protein [Melioribacter sp.]